MEPGRGTTIEKVEKKRQSAGERRQSIADAAVEVFVGRDFETVRMEEVAQQAGVSKALLYKHFPTKRELYLEVIRIIVARLNVRLADAARDLSPEKQLGATIAAYVRFANERRESFLSLHNSSLGCDPDLVAIIESVRLEIEEHVLGTWPSTPQVQVGARGVMGFVEMATARWLALPEGTMSETEAATLMESVLRAGLDRVWRAMHPA